MEPPKHEGRQNRSPVHRAIGLRGCHTIIITSNYKWVLVPPDKEVMLINDVNLVTQPCHSLSIE
jgi:hypothetical protein